MTYDLNKKIKKAIDVLKKNPAIITELQVYGQLGVSQAYWTDVMKKNNKFSTIDELITDNKARMSRCVTDNLTQQMDKGNVRSTELLGKIADREINKAWRYGNTEDEGPDEDHISMDDMKARIRKIIDDNGFHE